MGPPGSVQTVTNPARYDIFTALGALPGILGAEATDEQKRAWLVSALQPADPDHVRDDQVADELLRAALPVFEKVTPGVAVGTASVVVPAYIAELAPARLRGRLGSLQQVAIVLGIFIALLTDYAIASDAGSASSPYWLGLEAWRWMFWSELPPALLYGLAAFFIPESPRFLLARGREAEASRVLESVLGEAGPAKVAEIRRTLGAERRPGWGDLRGGLGLLPIVWIGLGVAALQQLVGINVIFYYSSVLWQAVGFSEKDALRVTAITGMTNIVTTFIGLAFVDRFGRKPLLLLGSSGMALALGTLTFLFGAAPLDRQGQPALTGASGVGALVAANAFVFFFGFSWGPVVWVLLGEMFNNRIRALALSLCAGLQWLTNFLVSATFPALQARGLALAYGLYTAAAVASLLFVWRFLRETRGKELEEM